MKLRRPLILLVLLLTSCGGVYYMSEAPPEPQIEEPGERPSPNQVWVSGHWRFLKGEYTWQAGEWLQVQPGKRWIPAYWHKGSKGWRFFPGFWEKAH